MRSSSGWSSATPRASSAGDGPGQHPAAARVQRPAQSRARPELPDRRQHPAGSSRKRRNSSRRTSCSRSAAAWACCPSTSRRWWAICTSWRWTGIWRRRSRDALAPFDNVTAPPGRCRRSSTSPSLRPAPGKVVANLPYGVAATVVLKSIEELPDATPLDRDGAARGGPAARRRARVEGLRRSERDRSALLRGQGAAPDLAQRLPPGPERRVRARAAEADRARAGPGGGGARARGVRAPPQGAPALPCRIRRRRPRPRQGRRWSRSGIRPTRAPSGSRRTTSDASRRYLRRDPRAGSGEGQPPASRRAAARGRPARAASRCSRRSTWQTTSRWARGCRRGRLRRRRRARTSPRTAIEPVPPRGRAGPAAAAG